MIIATAGHIDHGKSLLVKALTGVDTDRLPEEKARGMSIDLGFAYQPMEDGRVCGFVDVPGHERFIRNMLAGVTGIDYAMLIVAADDGPMPQTREHLAILNLLGVPDGVVALTKIDRVEPERIAEIRGEIEMLVAGTCLDGADILPVSAITGDGIEAMQEHLAAVMDLTEARDSSGNFRLAIDRSFTVQGAGLVVTGAVFSGTVSVGDRLVLSPQGTEVRVRGIHAQNRQAETGTVGERCALNLTGPDLKRDDVHRGGWVMDAAIHAPVARFDARLRVLADEARPLRHWTPVHVHLGAAEVPGRIAILGEGAIPPGGDGLVQIVLPRRIGALRGDGFILRDQSARRTIAGGTVIDPFPPVRGRAKPERIAFIEAMEEPAAEDALLKLLEQHPGGVSLKNFAASWNLTAEDAAALWELAALRAAGPDSDPIGFSPDHWDALQDAVEIGLRQWHEANPDKSGPAANALRALQPVRLSVAVFGDVLAGLVEAERLLHLGSGYCLPGFEPKLVNKDAALWRKVEPVLIDGHMQPPVVAVLSEQLGAPKRDLERFLVRAARLGLVFQVSKNRFLMPEALLELADSAEALAAETGEEGFGAAQFRDRANIGRNLAIEILEYFDRQGLTWRSDNTRKLRKPVEQVFGGI
ncbi:MAG: selenocysteine-specific translation elongation factor [Rhodospirillaceae bacterium]|jgi:selenocysteine-specific elongation factor|nr:selenocysteine-specific translation elongation factor [Rhodospirillaceae bacterium]MBT7572025.1 selenocysteine-specific translation elongation factor [Rhodospirillaceae bacterium]